MIPNGYREKLAEEIGVIAWAELQRHFARGVLVVVSPRLELLEVALALTVDDKGMFSDWLAGRAGRAGFRRSGAGVERGRG